LQKRQRKNEKRERVGSAHAGSNTDPFLPKEKAKCHPKEGSYKEDLCAPIGY